MPLLWFMINQHTFAYNGFGIIGIMALIAIGLVVNVGRYLEAKT